MPWKKLLFAVLCLLLFVNLVYAQQAGSNDTITIKVVPGRQPIIQSVNAAEILSKDKVLKPKREGNRANSLVLDISTLGTNCERSEGAIMVTASGGTPPYSYEINDYLGTMPMGYFPRRPPGAYVVTAYDANGDYGTGIATIPNTFDKPKLRYEKIVNPTCPGLNNGSVTLFAEGGTPPYSYSVDFINWQSSNEFTNLTPGYFYFYVKDANGCTANLFDFYGSVLCMFSLDISFVDKGCDRKGYISVRAYNGTAPYTYSLDGVNFVPDGDFQNLEPGRYVVYAKDATGKVSRYSVPISFQCYMTVNVTNAACTRSDGSFTIIPPVQAVPPLEYSIDGINYQAGNVFTGLRIGRYYPTIRDAAGTLFVSTCVVEEDCPKVSATVTIENCGMANGTITATGSGGVPPYEYSIDGINFQSGNLFTGLTAGTYIVTVKDANGNLGIRTVTVTGKCLIVSANKKDASCGIDNGTITVSGTGGKLPFQYSIDGVNFQSGNQFTGLAPGSYIVTIKDADNATITTTVVIEDLPAPEFTLNSLPATCTGNDGIINIHTTSGTGPFTFSLDGLSFQTYNQFTNLRPGQYTVTVKDGNDCYVSQPTVVKYYCLAITTTVTDDICGAGNGSITVGAADGEPPYEYSMDGTNYGSNNRFESLVAGDYRVFVRDARGEIRSTVVSIKLNCVTITALAENEICDNKNGRIVASVQGGSRPYEYSIDGNNFQMSNTFEQLAAGIYTITVKDATGIISSTQTAVEFTNGPALNVLPQASGCRNNDGAATITGSGGTSPLMYSIDGNQFHPSHVFNNLAAGASTAYVKDANGCVASLDFIVPLINDLQVDAGADKTICEGASVDLSAVSNADVFVWTPSTGLNPASGKNITASPTTTTKYFVTATTGQCSKEDSVTVFVNAAPLAIASPIDPICFGQSTILQGTGGVTCTWTPAKYLDDPRLCNPVVNKPVENITYQLSVTDELGCRSLNTASVTVTVTPPAKLSAGNDTAIMSGEPFNLYAADINNSGFTQYVWSPATGLSNPYIQDPEVIIDRPMTYTVTATTAAGCQGSDNISIKVYPGPEIYVPNAFSPNGDGRNDVLKAIPVGIKEFRYFAVYNRWGQQVFYTTKSSLGWDGKLGANAQGNNTFTWRAAGIDAQGRVVERKGVVVVVR